MMRVVVVGAYDTVRPLLDRLAGTGHAFSLVPALDALPSQPTPGPSMLLPLIPLMPGFAQGHAQPQPLAVWIGWNRTDDPALAQLAYREGALSVLPADCTVETLDVAIRTAQSLLRGHARPARRQARGEGRFSRGTYVHLDEADVLVVETGVVAMTVMQEDGSEVLMALHGPGAVVIGHPADSCSLHVQAITDVRAIIQDWMHISTTPHFTDRLRTQLRQMEARAAVQARPHLDDRLFGMLSLLADTFGVAHPDGICLDLRLTHTQLASAIGATRSTVTRLLARLRDAGLITTCGAGAAERIVLRAPPPHPHR
jgi:CRP-like cAMP-binding protein